MASPAAILNILVTANTKAASAQLLKVDRQMATTEKHSHRLAKAAGVASLAIGYGLAQAAKTGFDELKQSARVSAQTTAVLKSTGGAANVTAKQVDKLAQSLLRKSGVDDEVIKSGENMLLTFRNIRNEAGRDNDIFTRATKLTLDLSVAMGKDMRTSAILVGKALNDPVRGLTALRRVGVSFTTAQEDQIKALVKSGDTMKAQKIIMGELNKEFGGSAKAAGKTLPGQLDILRESYKNLAATAAQALLPVLQKIVPKITAFIQQMQEGKGAGGQFVDGLKNVRDTLAPIGKFFADHPKLAAYAVGAWVAYKTGALGALKALKIGMVASNPWAALATLTAAGLVASQQTVTAWSDKVKEVFDGLKQTTDPRGIDNFAAHLDALGAKASPFAADMRRAAAGIRSMNKPALDVQNAIDKLAHGVPADMSTIATSVRLNMRLIKNEMGSKSADAKEALSRNFMAGVDRIRAAMKAGLISTKEGLAKIREYFRKDLALYGITGKQANRYLSGHDTLTGVSDKIVKARGGFIGSPGERGRDTVPIMVGRGEAVLNRHQQGPVDAALRSTFGMGLGDLFNRTAGTRHFMAGGGFAGLQPGITGAVRRVMARFPGYSISSGFRTSMPLGHPDFHNYGQAADLVGPNMDAVGRWIDRTMGRGLTEGIHNPTLSIKNGQHVGAGFWGSSTWAGHVNHIHLAVAGKLAAMGFSPPQIKRVMAGGVGGALRGVVQGGLDRVRGAANHRLAMFAGGGFVGAAGLANLASQAGFSKSVIPLAVAIALAESGGRINAVNRNSDGSIDRGLWQINSTHGRLSTFNPLRNARAAYAISNHGRNWSQWTVFRTGAYRRFLSKARSVVGKGKAATGSKGAIIGGGATGAGAIGTISGGGYLTGISPLTGQPLIGMSTAAPTADVYTSDTGDPNQPLIDAQNAAAAAALALAEQIKGLKDEEKRRNDFATSVANVTSFQAVKALADVISGQIVGVSLNSRSNTASAGSTVRY